MGVAVGLALALWVVPAITRWWTEPTSEMPANTRSASPRFDFYDMLPMGEELVEERPAPAPQQPGAASTEAAAAQPSNGLGPEPSSGGSADFGTEPPAPGTVQAPGMYVLQLGAFTRREQAEALKARLALVGMNARIQSAILDRQTYYRVRIGPTSDLEQLNADRARLREHRFDSYLLRLVQ